jgi:hypothetical protein
MSGKRKKDYSAVFTEILNLITDPSKNYPMVEEIVSDFEKAVWVTGRITVNLLKN